MGAPVATLKNDETGAGGDTRSTEIDAVDPRAPQLHNQCGLATWKNDETGADGDTRRHTESALRWTLRIPERHCCLTSVDWLL